MYIGSDENAVNMFDEKQVYRSANSQSNRAMDKLNEKLIDDILTQLELAGPKGESISFLRTALYDKGWKGLGTLGRFEDLVTELGFTVVHERRKDGKVVVRTYVKV